MLLEECSDLINYKLEAMEKKEKIALWGAGENAVKLLQYTSLLNYNISYVIDRNKKLCGSHFFGMIVTEPDKVPWNTLDVVVISVFEGQDEIKNELEKKYCFKGNILLVHDGIQVPLRRLVSRRSVVPDVASVFRKNSIYKNIHAGERVFILCTGPSIAEMELTKLKDERTIAASGFYLHKDCQIISPDYYCIPSFENIYYDTDTAVELLKEIQKAMPSTKYFFSIHEKNLIEKIKEFEKECVNYITYSEISDYENTDIDLAGNIMGPQSVAILALEIALYMGFQTIYLLGTEHDSLLTNRYTHFYDYNASIASKVNDEEDNQGNLHSTFGEQLKCTCKLWEQYEVLKKIAERMGAKIYNATSGGILDVFERVDYDTLWNL